MAEQARDNVAQLKADIDAGRTGDKIAAGDPGLSPLGTDDEAAGRPASPERVRTAREQEARIGVAARREPEAKERAWFIPTLLIVLMLAVVIAAILVLRLAVHP